MTRRYASLLFAAASMALATGPRFAWAGEETAGTFGAPFLEIPVGARAIIVPGVVAGMQPDASLLFSNPALLGEIRQGDLFLSTANWLDEFNFTSASLAAPVRPAGLTLSLGTRILYAGGLKGYSASSQLVEEESFYDMAVTAGVSKGFDRLGLAVGGEVTYLREHLPSADGTGLTYSLGASYRFGRNRVAVSAQNIGGKISFPGREYPIESRVVLGYGRVIGALDLGAEISTSDSEYERLSVGGTYAVNRYLLLSAGMGHRSTDTSAPELPFSAGVGVRFDRFALDYAYTPQEYFSSTHTFSMGMSFGDAAGQRAARPSSTSGGRVGLPAADRPMSSSVAAPNAEAPATNSDADAPVGSFAVVAGKHSRVESASAEVRALQLLKVPAVVERTSKGLYRVLIARFETLDAAQKAIKNFEKRGHRFAIIAGSE